MVDGHGPFLSGRLHGQVDHLDRCLIGGKDLPVPDRLADDAIQRFDCIGGIDHLANIIGVVKQGNEVWPVFAPAGTDRRQVQLGTLPVSQPYSYFMDIVLTP